MTAYPLRLRPQGRITIHAGRPVLDGLLIACEIHLDLLGPDAAHLEPDLDITCASCRDAITKEN